ncbi:invasion associated locus B family protein [Shimia sp. Alg240-R146]|uniref:invasion associated locus B family protein n=1 Tax=Shimia sp. Alg240-R146 TaxID=2993449 RepID=UPI0022E3FB4B|nr:invasion associated locus B family protein [Shimia sp. Alg240-R146]
MGSRLVKALVAATGLSLFGVAGQAQESSDNQVAAMTDWSVFEHKDSDKRECWAVSTAKESVNTRGGQVVAVKRSDILLMVSYLPHLSVTGQVGFTGGYPFASGSPVNVDIDGNTFSLITEGEWAWPASEGDDAAIVAAMKRGKSAVFSAQSSRGTKTKDSFSLLGFTAAVEDAGKRCN